MKEAIQKDKGQKTDAQMLKASHFTSRELRFIRKLAKEAFSCGYRPFVLLGLCDSILENLVLTSDGVLKRKTLIKLLK